MKPPFPFNSSRRRFVLDGSRAAAQLSALAMFGGLEKAVAANADVSGYKALVCVYMTGGNNGFNTFVPLSDAGYGTYQNSRKGLALPRSSLLTLRGRNLLGNERASDGSAYGMHPACPELRSLFDSGNMAVLCNVGTLVQPTTLAQAKAGSVTLPIQLFSHIDQQTAWWTSVPDRAERYGWGGRIADLYASQGYSSALPMNINSGPSNYWQEGQRSRPYVLGANGSPTLVGRRAGNRGGQRASTIQALINQGMNDPNLLVAELSSIHDSAAQKVDLVNAAFSATGPLNTTFADLDGDFGLGGQLATVARCIRARSQLGAARQLFFVSIGGFDTHNNELADQQRGLTAVSKHLASFWNALGEMGLRDQVVTFTASDFGRTLGNNGDGSDHAWGNHHWVIGGAVRGGAYYGTMPSLAIGGADDIGAGRILPSTSTDQYAATLARWFGVADADLDGIFPNLRHFSQRNLGFV